MAGIAAVCPYIVTQRRRRVVNRSQGLALMVKPEEVLLSSGQDTLQSQNKDRVSGVSAPTGHSVP